MDFVATDGTTISTRFGQTKKMGLKLRDYVVYSAAPRAYRRCSLVVRARAPFSQHAEEKGTCMWLVKKWQKCLVHWEKYYLEITLYKEHGIIILRVREIET